MRYTLIAVLVLAACTGLSSYGYVTTYKAYKDVKVQNDTLVLAVQAEQERSARIQGTVIALEKMNAKSRTLVQTALAESPVWAAEPVPAVVATSLCERPTARCAPREVRAPGNQPVQ